MTTATLDFPKTSASPSPLVLTPDQQAALDAIYRFLLDPIETVFVLSGYSGCGKSTLVHTLLDQLPKFIKTIRIIDPERSNWDTRLTATTNKAAENLAHITGQAVSTIHSHLSLRVETDFKTGVSKLIPRSQDKHVGELLIIDEASYVDSQLLGYIFSMTEQCKILFVGDPAQLTPVKASGVPVFDAKFTGAELTQVVRQAEGNPIVQLATLFRHTVNTGVWPQFKPDGFHIRHLPRDAFDQVIETEFNRPDWKYRDSKILAWTNKRVVDYNHFVRDKAKGSPHFAVGDYAVCNSFIMAGKQSIKTDQMVQITRIGPEAEQRGVRGKCFEVNHSAEFFMPNSLSDKAIRVKQAKDDGDTHIVQEIEQEWIDLRAAYAQTVNKSQGSTYDKVFIDLDDIGRCNSGDQIARMLYVGVSRARHHVYLTGDLS
jgi:energy-coupling factor transporter ATP-binding protein EcfA2